MNNMKCPFGHRLRKEQTCWNGELALIGSKWVVQMTDNGKPKVYITFRGPNHSQYILHGRNGGAISARLEGSIRDSVVGAVFPIT